MPLSELRIPKSSSHHHDLTKHSFVHTQHHIRANEANAYLGACQWQKVAVILDHAVSLNGYNKTFQEQAFFLRKYIRTNRLNITLLYKLPVPFTTYNSLKFTICTDTHN